MGEGPRVKRWSIGVLGAGLLLAALGVGVGSRWPQETSLSGNVSAPPAGDSSRQSPRAHPPVLGVPPPAAGQPPVAVFAGKVVSRDNQPVPHAVLTFEYQGAAATAQTDAEGQFAFNAEPPGRWTLAAITADGFVPWEPEWGKSEVEFEAVRGTRLEGLRFTVDASLMVRGRVEDLQGLPVEGAQVISEASYSFEADSQPTFTRGDGSFEIPVAAQRTRATIVATKGGLSASAAWEPTDSNEGGIVLRLVPREPEISRARLPTWLDGVVVDESDAGVGDVLVMARLKGADYGEGTSPDGRFHLELKVPGPVQLFASRRGYSSVPMWAEVPSDGGVVVRIDSNTAQLEGRVTGPNSEPVESFIVAIRASADSRVRADVRLGRFSSPSGAFRILGLPRAPLSVRVAADGYEPFEQEVAAERVGTQEFRLSRGSILRGVAVDRRTRKRLPGIRVRLRDAMSLSAGPTSVTQGSAVTDSSGAFELRGVSAGRQELLANDPSRQYLARELTGIDVVSGEAHELITLDLEPAAGYDGGLEYDGIGATLQDADAGYGIIGFLPGSSAHSMGLRVGDVILAVDGAPTSDLEIFEVVRRIKGPEGTVVRLTVQRGAETFEISIARRRLVY